MSGPTLEACGTSATLTSDQHTRSDASTRRGNGGGFRRSTQQCLPAYQP